MTLDALTKTGALTGKVYTPQNVRYGADGNIVSFLDTYLGSVDAWFDSVQRMQAEGLLAQDAASPVDALTDEQKLTLRDRYDINNMDEQQRKDLLNELVEMGVLTAEQALRGTQVAHFDYSKVTTYIAQDGTMLRTDGRVQSSLRPPSAIYGIPNLMDFLRASLQNDAFFAAPAENTDAKNRILELLEDIFGSK